MISFVSASDPHVTPRTLKSTGLWLTIDRHKESEYRYFFMSSTALSNTACAAPSGISPLYGGNAGNSEPLTVFEHSSIVERFTGLSIGKN